jgi:hypothetical protein
MLPQPAARQARAPDSGYPSTIADGNSGRGWHLLAALRHGIGALAQCGDHVGRRLRSGCERVAHLPRPQQVPRLAAPRLHLLAMRVMMVVGEMGGEPAMRLLRIGRNALPALVHAA